ncbi:MAG TPA: hypothetical protein EYG74_00750 [Sulfurimonas autotrophica]|nr:hypothetical protein [Sulfurimonas autotrophica]
MIKDIVNVRPNPLQVVEGLKMLINVYKENYKVTEIETTKREEIQASKEIELEKIKSKRIILEQYFEGIFSERKLMINKMFDALDKGIETNNLELIQQSLGSIVAIAKESPLAGIQSLLSDYRNPNVQQITI